MWVILSCDVHHRPEFVHLWSPSRDQPPTVYEHQEEAQAQADRLYGMYRRLRFTVVRLP